MGDRTSVTVYVWHDDKEEFIAETPHLLGEPYEEYPCGDGFHCLSYEEVNYGGWDDLLAAAEKLFKFYGYHGTGGDYGAEEFASSGDGALQSAAVNQDSGNLVADVSWNPGQETFSISPESMERVGLFIIARNALRSLKAPD